ncbi:hypothetical protein ACFL96_03615 [Thermoproteota archaeon]
MYKFKLREDMPKGFKANDNYPELPAILEYLKQYEGQSFENVDQFNGDVVKGFLDWLYDRGVQPADNLVRKGLQLNKLKEPYQGTTHRVFVFSSSPAGRCDFGGLEKVTLH